MLRFFASLRMTTWIWANEICMMARIGYMLQRMNHRAALEFKAAPHITLRSRAAAPSILAIRPIISAISGGGAT
jgi:hypothetical protein